MPANPSAPPGRSARVLAVGVCVSTVALLLAGAYVTTTASGDAVPTWPFPLLPPEYLHVGPVTVEMTHRFVAGVTLLLTGGLAVVLARTEPRAWVRRLGWAALGLVVFQAVLGGVRVLLPGAVLKVAHAVTAQAFFCIAVTIAAAVSPWWRRAEPRDYDATSLSVLRTAAFGVLLLVAQLVLGALARHALLPKEVHAVFALLVFLAVARAVLLATEFPAGERDLRRPANALGLLAAAQLGLGVATYLVASEPVPPEERAPGAVLVMNLHLVVGAAMLGTMLLLLLRTARLHGLPTDERLGAAGLLPGSGS